MTPDAYTQLIREALTQGELSSIQDAVNFSVIQALADVGFCRVSLETIPRIAHYSSEVLSIGLETVTRQLCSGLWDPLTGAQLVLRCMHAVVVKGCKPGWSTLSVNLSAVGASAGIRSDDGFQLVNYDLVANVRPQKSLENTPGFIAQQWAEWGLSATDGWPIHSTTRFAAKASKHFMP